MISAPLQPVAKETIHFVGHETKWFNMKAVLLPPCVDFQHDSMNPQISAVQLILWAHLDSSWAHAGLLHDGLDLGTLGANHHLRNGGIETWHGTS